MASPKNGQITFYFDTLPELHDQLRAALGLGYAIPGQFRASNTPDPAAVAAEQAENDRRLEHAVATHTRFVPVGVEPAQVEAAQRGAEATEFNASPMVGRTPSGIPEEVRKGNQEAAAVALSAVEPVSAKAEPKAAPAPEQNAPALTLETLADAPYPELLAFCEHNPAVGVDVSKCQAAFFRKLVEMKIKAYLETK